MSARTLPCMCTKQFRHLTPPSNYSRSFSTGAHTALAVSRTFPASPMTIFETIADIPSYPAYLPYVSAAEVISYSARRDVYFKQKWPARASLTIGFHEKISETFTSRVFCVPPVPHKGRAGVGFIEAISGPEAPVPSFGADEDVSHYDLGSTSTGSEEVASGPLAFLRTRWTVASHPYKPAPPGAEETHAANLEPEVRAKEMTDVSLVVEYRFQNPVYGLMGQAAGRQVAEKMIEAFEKRVKQILR